MWVAKLGGSLSESRHLRAWLQVLAEHGAGRCIIVPGGGPFADAVRQTQVQWRYPDAVAHQMALLAMVQYGLMVSGMQRGLVTAAGTAELRAALERGCTPVWLPVPMAAIDPAIETSWQVTSDSLALWLAQRLGCKNLLLIKSTTAPATDIRALSEQGFVDRAFAEYAARYRGTIVTLCADEAERFTALVDGAEDLSEAKLILKRS